MEKRKENKMDLKTLMKHAECVKQWEDIEPLLGDWKIVDKKEERRNNSHD